MDGLWHRDRRIADRRAAGLRPEGQRVRRIGGLGKRGGRRVEGQRQGKQAEAYELHAPVYGWCTEGFDTADLQGAKALLEELEG